MLTERVAAGQTFGYGIPEEVLVIDLEDEPPDWLPPILDRFEELLSLDPNWDSYGALPINPTHAVAALRLLTEIMCGTTPVPAIVPTVQGHIQVEWHTPTTTLEIETLSVSRFHVYMEDTVRQIDWEGEIVSNFTPLVHHISAFSGHP